tara:strand:+ start:8952 stop:9668 length:717 start_codon:yes stop_codon:yes gene_type:complete
MTNASLKTIFNNKNNMQAFQSFVNKYYTWVPGSGYELSPELDDDTPLYAEMRRGKIKPASIVSYATLVDSLWSQTLVGLDSTVSSQKQVMQAGRQAYGRTAELDYQIRAGDTKDVQFTKNVIRFCKDNGIGRCDELIALSGIRNFRVPELRPIGLYLGFMFMNMTGDGEEKIEEEEEEEKMEEEEVEDEALIALRQTLTEEHEEEGWTVRVSVDGNPVYYNEDLNEEQANLPELLFDF